MKVSNLFLGQKWRSIITSQTAVVREIRDTRVMVSIEGCREWLLKSELFSAWKPVGMR